jgi:hypothetical protein
MERHVAEHPQGSEGVHRYTPEQFGIDPDPVRGQWSDYIERFGIAPE